MIKKMSKVNLQQSPETRTFRSLCNGKLDMKNADLSRSTTGRLRGGPGGPLGAAITFRGGPRPAACDGSGGAAAGATSFAMPNSFSAVKNCDWVPSPSPDFEQSSSNSFSTENELKVTRLPKNSVAVALIN